MSTAVVVRAGAQTVLAIGVLDWPRASPMARNSMATPRAGRMPLVAPEQSALVYGYNLL